MVKRILIFLFVMALAAGIAYAAPADVPQTGQTDSDATGDDGDLEKGVEWPSPRFVVSGDCVTDNLTGLMWTRTPDSSSRTWTEALTYADGLALCGYSDWRLPNLNEMESLVHAGQSDSATWLNDQGFVAVGAFSFWTSTTYAPSENSAWYGDIKDGYFGFNVKEDPDFISFAWAVRAGQ